MNISLSPPTPSFDFLSVDFHCSSSTTSASVRNELQPRNVFVILPIVGRQRNVVAERGGGDPTIFGSDWPSDPVARCFDHRPPFSDF
ncbi:MAG TPA: hypothetical protein VL992_02535 [Tepidisphaeraceae bacterium]|nr:hypothetical protein [Tepidisphaeraceae bacterium]